MGTKTIEGIGIPPEHDPFKDGDNSPNRDERDIDIFRGEEDEDYVNTL